MLRRLLAATIVSLTLATNAKAQTDLTFTRYLSLGGVATVNFQVTTAGTFDLWTTSALGPSGTTPFDPQLFLFRDGLNGTWITADDDSCDGFMAQCGNAAFAYNSIINNIFLDVGSYTAAVTGCCNNPSDLADGSVSAAAGYSGNFQLRIASLEEYGGGSGVATGPERTVPEPGSAALTACGLVMLGALTRRRRNA